MGGFAGNQDGDVGCGCGSVGSGTSIWLAQSEHNKILYTQAV